jgi:hypothetical protein
MDDDPYVPLLSQDIYDSVMRRVLAYAMCNNMKQLVYTLVQLEPDLKSTNNNSAVLAQFLALLIDKGPLPEITNHMFMNTLYTGVVQYLKRHSDIRDKMHLESILKLESGLRFLLVRSLLYSNGKFRRTDVEAASYRYFTDNIDQIKAILCIKGNEEGEIVDKVLESYKIANQRARSYFKNRIRNPEQTDMEDPGLGALTVYELEGNATCSIKNALKTLLQHIQSTFSTVLDDFFFEAQSDEALEYEESAVIGVTPIHDNVATDFMDIESAQSPASSQYYDAESQPMDQLSLDHAGIISEDSSAPDKKGYESTTGPYNHKELNALQFCCENMGSKSEPDLIQFVKKFHDINTQSRFFLNMHNF